MSGTNTDGKVIGFDTGKRELFGTGQNAGFKLWQKKFSRGYSYTRWIYTTSPFFKDETSFVCDNDIATLTPRLPISSLPYDGRWVTPLVTNIVYVACSIRDELVKDKLSNLDCIVFGGPREKFTAAEVTQAFPRLP